MLAFLPLLQPIGLLIELNRDLRWWLDEAIVITSVTSSERTQSQPMDEETGVSKILGSIGFVALESQKGKHISIRIAGNIHFDIVIAS